MRRANKRLEDALHSAVWVEDDRARSILASLSLETHRNHVLVARIVCDLREISEELREPGAGVT